MIVVIGAGPAGLATAWRLSEAGHEVVVVEASRHVGGLAGSRTVSGIPVDLGRHQLDPAMPPSVRTALEGLADLDEQVELQERPRRARIRMGDAWVPYPLRPLGTLRGLGPAISARVAVEAVAARLHTPGADTYAEVLRAAHGPTVWRHVHEPHAWKLWDTDPSMLAGELTRSMVGDAARSDTYLYPRDGFGSLWQAVADRLPDVRTGTKVTGLIEHDERVTVGLADGRILSADRVFSTLPAGRVASWLGLVEPASVAMPTRSMVLVYLTVAGRRYTDHDTHVLPGRTLLPTRISEPTNHRDRPDDPDDRTVLCAEVPCWEDDPIWRAPADGLARRVADDLVRCGLPDPRVLDVHVERLPSAHPVLTAASLAARGRAETALSRSRRVVVLGRHGPYAPVDTHRVVQMGFAAAACVGHDGEFDHGAWRAARHDCWS